MQSPEEDYILSTTNCTNSGSLRKLILESNVLFLSFYSVHFSHSVVSDSLRPHELQHARPPCPSPTPRVHSNSCPSSRWCHPAISSSAVPFSSCPQSLSASESFPMSWFFASGGQCIGVSTSASVLPVNIQDWFPLDELVGFPCSPRDSQESSPTPQFKSIILQNHQSVVDVTCDGNKVRCCKEQYCIGTWNVRSMNVSSSFLYSPTLTSIHDYW